MVLLSEEKDTKNDDSLNPARKSNLPGKESSDSISATDGSQSPIEESEKRFFKPRTNKKRRFGSKKIKSLIGGGGLIFGVGIFGLLMSSFGSLELGNLKFITDKSSRISGYAKEARIYGFTRAARAYNTGDVGQTRVGFIGSRIYGNLADRLETRHGITFERREATGRLQKVRFRIPGDSILNGDGNIATRANIINQLNLANPENLVFEGFDPQNNRPIFTYEVANSADLDRMQNNMFELDSDTGKKTKGVLHKAASKRVMRKFWNAPRLYNPISRTAAAADENIRNRVDARRAAELERKGRPGKIAQLSTKYQSAIASARQTIGPRRAAATSGALTFTGGLCVLKEISDLIPSLNYANIMVGAMEEGIDKQAVASQAMADTDIEDFDFQVGLVLETFKDQEGGTIWGSAALSDDPNGQRLDPALEQAIKTRGGNIEQLVDMLVDESGDAGLIKAAAAGGDEFAKYACSGPGYAIQLALGAALTLTGPGGVLAKTSSFLQSAAVIAVLTNILGDFVAGEAAVAAQGFCGKNEDGVTVDAAKYGNCIAYGVLLADNTAGYASGGIPLTPQQQINVTQKVKLNEIENIRSKSFIARLFDTNEPKSLLMTTLRTQEYHSLNNTASMASGIFSAPINFASNIGGILSSRALANSNGYVWEVPVVSVPLEIIEDPRFEDPYENQILAANIFNQGDSEIKRARSCFGVDIKKNTSGLWISERLEEVNPTDDDYINARCDDLSDENWIRTMLFVFDDSLTLSMDCIEGGLESSESSCEEIGVPVGEEIEQGVDPTVVTNTGASAQYIPNCEANDGNAKIACVAIDTMLGIPYKNGYSSVPGCRVQPSGTTDPNPQQLDCSAFTAMAVYRAFGVSNVPRTSVNYLTSPLFEVVGDTRDGSNSGDLRLIQPGDIIGRGRVASGGGGNGHVGIVVDYNPATGELITAETDRCAEPSRIVTTKGLKIDGKGGTYEWAVRYIGPKK